MAIEALALFVALASAALTTVILVRVSRFDPAAQRQGIDASLSRLDQLLRQEFALDRQESAVISKLLREEVQLTLKQMTEQLNAAVGGLRQTVEGRLDVLRTENAVKLEQ